MIIEHAAAAHQDERGIADQRRDPAAEVGVGRADLRIERAHRQQVADHRDLHVDQEQELGQPARDTHRIAGQRGHVERDDRREAAGQDRDHEGAEEALHRPGAQVFPHLLAVERLAPDQHCAEVPGAVARVHQPAVEPQHVRHRQHEQRRGGEAQHFHREQVLPAPVPAGDAIEEGDDRPGRPQPGKLGDRNVRDLRKRARAVPVDAGGSAAVNLVDQQRPKHHRPGREQQRRQRRVRPGERLAGAAQRQRIGDLRPVAANRDPEEQPGEPGEPDTGRHVAFRPGQDRIGGRVSGRIHAARA